MTVREVERALASKGWRLTVTRDGHHVWVGPRGGRVKLRGKHRAADDAPDYAVKAVRT